jgi:hypothetical protein
MIREGIRGHQDDAHGLGGACHSYPAELPNDRSSTEAGHLRNETGRALR